MPPARRPGGRVVALAHKRIADTDIAHAMNASNLLPEFSRQTIEDALRLMRGVLQGVSDWTDSVELGFYPNSVGDADNQVAKMSSNDRHEHKYRSQRECRIGNSNQRRGMFTISRSTHCGDLTAGTIARTWPLQPPTARIKGTPPGKMMTMRDRYSCTVHCRSASLTAKRNR